MIHVTECDYRVGNEVICIISLEDGIDNDLLNAEQVLERLVYMLILTNG